MSNNINTPTKTRPKYLHELGFSALVQGYLLSWLRTKTHLKYNFIKRDGWGDNNKVILDDTFKETIIRACEKRSPTAYELSARQALLNAVLEHYGIDINEIPTSPIKYYDRMTNIRAKIPSDAKLLADIIPDINVRGKIITSLSKTDIELLPQVRRGNRSYMYITLEIWKQNRHKVYDIIKQLTPSLAKHVMTLTKYLDKEYQIENIKTDD